MRRVVCIFAMTGLLVPSLFSQGMKDSVYLIEEVAITRERMFIKEEAGMKQTLVDSMVLQERPAFHSRTFYRRIQAYLLRTTGVEHWLRPLSGAALLPTPRLAGMV